MSLSSGRWWLRGYHSPVPTDWSQIIFNRRQILEMERDAGTHIPLMPCSFNGGCHILTPKNLLARHFRWKFSATTEDLKRKSVSHLKYQSLECKLKEPTIIPWIHRTYCIDELEEPSRIGEFHEFSVLEPAQTIVSWIHWTGKHLKGCPVYRLQADHIERMKSGDWVEGNPQRSKQGHNDTRFSVF